MSRCVWPRQPESDRDLVAYRVYIADRKVEIARADAQTRYAEDQRAVISAQRDQARLAARTHEANVAEAQAAAQKAAADQARGEANVAVGAEADHCFYCRHCKNDKKAGRSRK